MRALGIALSKCPEAKRAENLARELGTEIPGGITEQMWALPLLERLYIKIEALQLRVEMLEVDLGRRD
jgi:hypothetical protein